MTGKSSQGGVSLESGTAIAGPGDREAEGWSGIRAVLVASTIVIAAIAVYRPTVAFGLFSDDFQWLAAARHVSLQQFITLGNHFYRPGTLLYFVVANDACGYTAPCYHSLAIGLHVLTSVLVAVMVALLSRQWQPGALAGILFVVQPASVEAVVWVSAISEVIATAWFVLTVLLFAYATRIGSAGILIAAWMSAVATLASHESGIMVLPMLCVAGWFMHDGPFLQSRAARWLVPFVLPVSVYALMSYIVNSRSYLVTNGQYAIGSHVISNVLGALVSFAVARRDVVGFVAVTVAFVTLILIRRGAVRFYAVWILLTLLPFAGFRGGLSSRYLYLSGVGFAGLLAHVLWWSRRCIGQRRLALAVWWIVIVGVVVRSEAFASKNARSLQHEQVAFAQYARAIRSLSPSLPPTHHLSVPAPPPEVADRYVEPLLQWEYRDPALTVSIFRP